MLQQDEVVLLECSDPHRKFSEYKLIANVIKIKKKAKRISGQEIRV